jgi:hypothetical protein
MITFGEMVEQTLGHLRSEVRDQEISTHLTQDLLSGDSQILVADAQVLSRGRIQIGDELVWIDSADRAQGYGSIPPYGRGMDGTHPEDHAAGRRVIVAPLFPRKTVKDALNQAIRQVGGTLYGVDTIEFTARSDGGFIYSLPEVVSNVLSVKMADKRGSWAGSDVVWLREWQFDRRAPVAVSVTGKALYVYDRRCTALSLMMVTFSRDPLPLMFDTQLFSQTFLPESAADIVILFAASRLLATADAYNLQTRAVEANTLDSKVQPGEAVNQSKYLLALAKDRLNEERLRLLNSTTNRVHYNTRGR